MFTVTQPSYRNRIAYQAGLLGAICCLLSVLLIIGNQETAGQIQNHIEQERRAILTQVLPSELYDNEPLDHAEIFDAPERLTSQIELFKATLDGRFSGAALQTSVYGWGSDIKFIIAIGKNGEITGVRVLSHAETPGLADKIEIEKDAWITSFEGMSLAKNPQQHWAVEKDGGIIDQFTGATITPRALVKGVHQSLQFLESWRQAQAKIEKASNNEEAKKT